MGTAVLTRSAFRRYRFPVVVWATVAATLVGVAHLSAYWSGRTGDRFPGWFDPWFQFDSWEYLAIAERGYSYVPGTRANVVFFPLYPLLIEAVAALGIGERSAALVISFVAGLAAAAVFWQWLRRFDLDRRARTAALGVLLLYPYGWFLYGVVYSDALFLLLVLGAFCMIERRSYIAAAALGALATATRPTGIALVPALFLLALEREGVVAVPSAARGWVGRFSVPVSFVRERWGSRLAVPLLSVVGVGAYMTYLAVRWGDPLLWATNQTEYHPPGWFSLLKGGLVGNLVHWTDPIYTLTITGQALVAVAVLLTAPAVGRRFGWGYAVFVLVLVAIPSLSTSDFNGTGRYLMAAFPTAAVAGEWLADRPTGRRVWFGVSAVLLVLMTAGFAQSVMLT